MTIFDAETTALSDAELELVKPAFKAPANYKKPEAIAGAIAEAEAAWKARAALDAKTARILAIGLLGYEDSPRILAGDEVQILADFWKVWQDGERLVGFACKGFDMPLFWQRSIILGIKPPMDVLQGRYWSLRIIDLQEVWNCFGRDTSGQSLDAICKALKLGQKTGNGADFARLWETDNAAARLYLENDLRLTRLLSQRLGIT